MVWGQEDFPGDEALIARFLAQISGRSVEGRTMKTGVVAAVACLCAACAALDVPFEIRLPKEAEPHEDWASRELGSYLARRVIGSLTVEGLDGVTFHVGDTPLAMEKGYSSKNMLDEQWIVKSYGSDVVLNGGGTRGAIYAVSHFLEDFCGVRWWSPSEDFVPPATPLVLPRLNVSGRPAFRLRTLYTGLQEPNADRVAAHLRLNDFRSLASGGGFRYGSPGHCHTFDKYLPVEKHFKDHPEWYSFLKSSNCRVGGQHGGQLCLTDPGCRAAMKDRLKEFIAADRADSARLGIAPPTVYDISENDNWNYCECEKCLEAKGLWNQSGLMLDFINDIASSIRNDYPDILVNTFAYHGTEAPPKGGKCAADNVMVRLCNTQSNRAAGMSDPDHTRFRDNLDGWAKSARHISIWDYAITFTRELTGLPLPSEFYYAGYFRACTVRGVRGFFWEHESPHKADMWELKYFLETKLMENPLLDSDELIRTFMNEYYGAAGGKVLEYRCRLDAARRARKGFVSWFPSLSDFEWLTEDDIASGLTFLAAAERATGGEEPFLSRVRRVRVGLDRLVCLRARASGRADTPAAREAAARLKAFWPLWMDRYPAKGRRSSADELVAAIGLPPPKRFFDRRICDFPAQFISPGSGNEKSVRIVDDPESEVGRAIQIDADDSDHYNLPYVIGLYDMAAQRSVVKKSFPRPLSETGYAWYDVGVGVIPTNNATIYLSGTWQTHISMKDKKELYGRKFAIHVSAKFTGRKYRPGSDEPSRIWIDRVVLVEE